MSSGGGGKSVGFVLVALCLLLGPVLVLGWVRLRTEDRLSGIDPPVEAVVVESVVRVDSGRKGGSMNLWWSEAAVVRSPMWSGVVTEVLVAPGDVLESGSLVVEVDGVDRVALASPKPFWRFLGEGSSGSDVEWLEELLSEQGLFDGIPDEKFNSVTARAVELFASSLGLDGKTRVFDPSWVVWMPSEGFEVASVEATVGAVAPAFDSVLLAGPVEISGAEFVDYQGAAVEIPGEWVFLFDDASPLSLVDGALTEESRFTLEDLVVPGVEAVNGWIERAVPVESLAVPSTALVSDVDGSLCVHVEAGSGYEPRQVVLSGGAVSESYVGSGLEAGVPVLANPADMGVVGCH